MSYHPNNNDITDTVEDGWGSDIEIDDDDDDDLNVDDQNHNNNYNHHDSSSSSSAITPITTNRKMVTIHLDGVTEEEEEGFHVNTELPPPKPTTTTTTNTNINIPNDGWGIDDDDDDDIDIDDDDDANDNNKSSENNRTGSIPSYYYDVEPSRLAPTPTPSTSSPPNHMSSQSTTTSTIGHIHGRTSSIQYQNKKLYSYTPMEYELHDYIISISQRRIKLLQQILQHQYNTTEKAMELYQYYQQRPQLLQYTIEKELSRLQYTIITTTTTTGDVKIIQDKDEIRHILSSLYVDHNTNSDSTDLLSLSICGRCANQSILVDVVQAMSLPSQTLHSNNNHHHNNDHDMVLLPSKYMCSAVASHCHFTIDLIQCSVRVESYFQISIPLLNDRWNIGQIQLSITFHCPTMTSSNFSNSSSSHPPPPPPQEQSVIPTPPRVEFLVEDYQSSLMNVPDNLDDNTDEVYYNKLHQSATIINELSSSMMNHDNDDDDIDFQLSNHQSQPAMNTATTNNRMTVVPEGIVNFRDVYVNELLTTTNTVVVDGMKSAWQDLDTATGLLSKFKKLPSFLPTIEPIMDDDDNDNEEYGIVATISATTMNRRTDTNISSFHTPQQHHIPLSNHPSISHPSNVIIQPTFEHKPPPPPPPSRPTSLLGGFVRSLAQSVTLPQEDPSIYQEWQQQQYPNEPHRQWHQPTITTTTTGNSNSSSIIPKLYNIETPKPSRIQMDNEIPENVSARGNIPHLYSTATERHDVPVVGKEQQNTDNNHRPNAAEMSSELDIKRDISTHDNMQNTTTTSDVVSSDLLMTHTVTNLEINSEHPVHDGWDDDIDIDDVDDSQNDTDPMNSIGVENKTEFREDPSPVDNKVTIEHNSDDVVSSMDWVYDPVTDIVPTRTRYRNPIGGSRDLRYM